VTDPGSARAEVGVVVVGGGHAGIEAAAAAARLGCRTLLVTFALDRIGALSCNPAVGGVGKGQLVREVDALGGLMGELADAACIQHRQLNAARGAAVRSTRMQVDLERYAAAAQARLRALPGLELLADEAVDLVLEGGAARGVVLARNGTVRAEAVVLAPGTFWHGLLHFGLEHFPGGRLGDPAAAALPERLARLGFTLGRFKTGTTPRLDGRSIDFSRLREQAGDPEFLPFSRRSPRAPALPQRSCFLTRTNERTHEVIRANLHRSALYSGTITATGVRYCPSVEDKIVKFPGHESHHVFLEPEGLDTDRWYPNGLSNSLPREVQLEMVRTLPGLERAEIVQAGYAIEHDHLDPTQLTAALETKPVPGLFCAGQINGTTGYEEAAAQGLLAGCNAARRARGEAEVVLDRGQAYLGVLVDDLVTKGTAEPYRMFTSRVEYRLVVREDNTESRLAPLGRELGLVGEEAHAAFLAREAAWRAELARVQRTRVPLAALNERLTAWDEPRVDAPLTLEELLRRTAIEYPRLAELDPEAARVAPETAWRVRTEVKYAGYIRRQEEELAAFRKLERLRIPGDFTYAGLPGLSHEVVEKLTRLRPRTLGQAGRVSGVTPAAVTLLMWVLKRGERDRAAVRP
jgi:tRNA uridine 5-carboxymethylaminomethyl modification enzyme